MVDTDVVYRRILDGISGDLRRVDELHAEGARASGLRAVWLETAQQTPPAEADATIRSLSELPAVLAAW